MPVWFFVLLAIVLLVAVLLALTMGFGRSRGSAGGQNTTIIERRPSETDRQDVTVVEGD
jgi:hypothetical protein